MSPSLLIELVTAFAFYKILLMEELKVHSSRREHHRSSSKTRTSERNDSIISEIRAKDGCGSVGVNANQQSENVVAENRLVRNVDASVGSSSVQDVTQNESNILEDSTCVDKIHSGIIGYVDRDIHRGHRKPLSDPTAASSPQRSTRSRSSLEKSPHSKRSKSESRRRRERKMIAAGELEVKQANETLMRYLRQCTEINDASLSGDIDIDKSIDDRRVHRKTRSQRERRNMQLGKTNGSRERMSANGLTSILSDLVDDIIPSNNGDIYNPFTPVISPTEGPPARIEKMFVQTSRNSYRSVDHDLYRKQPDHDIEGNM